MDVRGLRLSDVEEGYLETLATFRPAEGLTMAAATLIVRDLLSNPAYQIFVVVIDGRVVGTATLFVEQKLIHGGGRVGHIEDLIVHPRYLHQGCADRLLNTAVHEARRRGCYKVILNSNENRVPLYQSVGFHRGEIQMRRDL